MSRLMRLWSGEWRFINYRKKFNGGFPISGWKPNFDKFWHGDIWQITWRGFAISVDMRKDWIGDMINPNRD